MPSHCKQIFKYQEIKSIQRTSFSHTTLQAVTFEEEEKTMIRGSF